MVLPPMRDNWLISASDAMPVTSDRFRFSASVAGFGQLLRGGKFTDNYQYADVLELARNARGSDSFGYRGEFISLVNLAKTLETTRVKG